MDMEELLDTRNKVRSLVNEINDSARCLSKMNEEDDLYEIFRKYVKTSYQTIDTGIAIPGTRDVYALKANGIVTKDKIYSYSSNMYAHRIVEILENVPLAMEIAGHITNKKNKLSFLRYVTALNSVELEEEKPFRREYKLSEKIKTIHRDNRTEGYNFINVDLLKVVEEGNCLTLKLMSNGMEKKSYTLNHHIGSYAFIEGEIILFPFVEELKKINEEFSKYAKNKKTNIRLNAVKQEFGGELSVELI